MLCLPREILYPDGEKFSLTEVGAVLGHKSVKTTQTYARTSEDDLAAEMARRPVATSIVKR